MVYKLDPQGYFREEGLLNRKSEKEVKNQESHSENLYEAPLDPKIVKIKGVSFGENFPKAPEDEDYLLSLINAYVYE